MKTTFKVQTHEWTTQRKKDVLRLKIEGPSDEAY